jgi:hypothetical protein
MNYYHRTSIDAAASIRANGFRPSVNGELGPGVYLAIDPDDLTVDKFAGTIAIPVSVSVPILQVVDQSPNRVLAILRAIHGRKHGDEAYDCGKWWDGGAPDWSKVHEAVGAAGFCGITYHDSISPKNTVVFRSELVEVQETTPSAAIQRSRVSFGRAIEGESK